MNITLYKNCPIPDDYGMIWNNTVIYRTAKTAHQTLLDSLTSVTINIADIYLNDNGEIILDLEDVNNAIWFNDYNYMSYEIQRTSENDHKTTTTNTYTFNGSDLPVNKYVNYLKRYAFIDKVEYFNDCIKIHYKSDIWSTYSPMITDAFGILSNYSKDNLFRITSYNSGTHKYSLSSIYYYHLNLPEEYYSNGKLKCYGLDGLGERTEIDSWYNKKCYCIVQVQFSDSVNQGQVSKRLIDTCILMHSDTNATLTMSHTVDDWSNLLVNLLQKQATANAATIYPSQDTMHFEISNIYFIPFNICSFTGTNPYEFDVWEDVLTDVNNFVFLQACRSAQVQITANDEFEFISLARYCDYTMAGMKTDVLNHNFLLCDRELDNDLKRIGIGFYTNVIPIDQTNVHIKLKYGVRFAFDNYNVRIYLEMNQKIIEITNDLSVEFPISVESGNATQLQALTRTVANQKNASNAAFGVMKGISTAAVGGAAAAATGGVGAALGAGGIVSGIMGAAQSVTNAAIESKMINAKVYQTSKGAAADSTGFINAYYGLLSFKITPINEIEMTHLIKRKGYILSETEYASQYVDNCLFTSVIPELCYVDYVEFIRYTNAYISGTFSSEIKRKLLDIIQAGAIYVGNSNNAIDYLSKL